MEISIALFIFIGAIFFSFWVRISDLNAKIDILLHSSVSNWDECFTSDMYEAINKGRPEKAAMLLRKETGLDFNDCLSIVKKHGASASNT